MQNKNVLDNISIISFICGIVGLLSLFSVLFSINILNKYSTINSINIVNGVDYNSILLLSLLFIPFLLSVLAIIFGFISRKNNNIKIFSIIGRILGGVVIIPVLIGILPAITNNVWFGSGNMHIKIFHPRRPIYSLFTEVGHISTTTKNNLIVEVNLIIGYDPDDFAILSELSTRKEELNDFIKYYFNNKYDYELRPEHENALRKDIMENINNLFLENGRIRLILFDKLDQIYPY